MRWLLASWILVFAALFAVHARLLLRAVRAKGLSWGQRSLALIPPFAPFVAWAAGGRVMPVLWGILLVSYVGLRMLG